MKYSDKVLIEKETDSKKRTPESIRRNPHAVDNVNQIQGPRVGMASAHAGKRGVFREAKTEREPLADMVMNAFGARGRDDKEKTKPGLESISADSKRKFKK